MTSKKLSGRGLTLSFTRFSKCSKAFPLNYIATTPFSNPSNSKDRFSLNKTHSPDTLLIIEASII